MTKVFLAVLLFSSMSFATTRLECVGANGVQIQSKGDTTVGTTWFGVQKDFSYSVNPAFFNWTWIVLTQGDQVAAQGYHIFLLGNAREGAVSVLHGSIGKVVSVPTAGRMQYPIGFAPVTPVSCKVYWSRK